MTLNGTVNKTFLLVVLALFPQVGCGAALSIPVILKAILIWYEYQNAYPHPKSQTRLHIKIIRNDVGSPN